MTFGEHLDELRSRLLRSILAFGLMAAAALTMQDELFRFFVSPYQNARQSILDRVREGLPAEPIGENGTEAVTEVATGPISEREALILLLEELEKRGVQEATQIGARLSGGEDVKTYLEVERHDPGPLRAIGMTEKFFAYLKTALLTAAILSAPVLLYQLWQFIGAGLYTRERLAVARTLPLSLGMFGLGLLFGFKVLVPVALDFLLSYGDPDLVEANVTVSSYLSLLFVLLFVMGLVFQVPLVMTVVARMGLVQPKTFRKNRKYFLLGAFVMAALLTPPDYVTQLLVATPMVVLFELGILLSVLASRKRNRAREPDTS